MLENSLHHRQEHHVDVVEAGGASGDGALEVREAFEFEVASDGGQVVSTVTEEREQEDAYDVLILHKCSAGRKNKERNL